MTTWESIDNVDMENVTVTSDAAFERVTSDEHFEEEKDSWYLKQNTSWLVQEIPNISFLDIWDTMLEWKKTLHWKDNWNVVVWSKWKSIEAIPQDSIVLRMLWDQSVSSPSKIEFDWWDKTSNITTMDYDYDNYRIRIDKKWWYRISYWWTVDLGSATQLLIAIFQNSDDITWDDLRGISWTRLSWWRSICVELNEWDYITMWINADSAVTVKEKYTYFQIQYIWQSI